MSVAGLVLAAGAGRRLGRPKALVRMHGEPLAERACRTLAAGGCDPVVVVVGADARLVRASLALPSTVDNPGWREGVGSSLRTGLAALDPAAGAVVVALVDQPFVEPEAVRRLVAAWRNGAVAAVATYAGRQRNPVLLAREVFADVSASAAGEVGARAWLRAHPERVTAVPCDDVGSPDDIDTPADLAAAQAYSGRGRTMSAAMTNENLVRVAYDAYLRGDIATMLTFVDADLEWTYLDPGLPDAKPQTCHGRDQLEFHARRLAERGLRSELEEVVANGDRVLAIVHTPGLDAQRARQANDRNYDVLTIRDGRITALRACRDRAEALRLAGLR